MADPVVEPPEPPLVAPATPREQLDAAVAALREHAPAWNTTDVGARLDLLRRLVVTTHAAGPDWVAAAAAAKGIAPDSPLMREDWGSGIVLILRHLRLLERTLSDIAATGAPQPPDVRVDGPDGRVVVDVLPTDRLDAALYRGFRAEVRLAPGVTVEQARARMGRIYRPGYRRRPQVVVVLGAGNISSIGPMDVLHQLFVLDRVVLLKMHPVNDHLAPHLAEAFEPLVRAGFLRIVHGDADVGSYLTDHDGVDAIHLTGSEDTYDTILFGDGPDGRARRARGERRLEKAFTAELGNVTPVIVVPGPWNGADVTYQGHNLASMLVENAGFNCAAARVIVQHRAWSKRAELLDAVRASLRRAEARVPYYPGAVDRWRRFTEAHPTAEWFQDAGEHRVPFTLIPDLDADEESDLAFTTEPFCGVVGEVALDASRSIPDYLDAAVEFCNGGLYGTLAASILVHPRSLDDPAVAAALERAIGGLAYGSVVINHFAGAAYAFVSPPWGGHPGSSAGGGQSGHGMVHNTYMVEDVEKTVVRGPFRPSITPVWFHTHRTAHELLPKLADLTATQQRRRLPSVLWRAARG